MDAACSRLSRLLLRVVPLLARSKNACVRSDLRILETSMRRAAASHAGRDGALHRRRSVVPQAGIFLQPRTTRVDDGAKIGEGSPSEGLSGKLAPSGRRRAAAAGKRVVASH